MSIPSDWATPSSEQLRIAAVLQAILKGRAEKGQSSLQMSQTDIEIAVEAGVGNEYQIREALHWLQAFDPCYAGTMCGFIEASSAGDDRAKGGVLVCDFAIPQCVVVLFLKDGSGLIYYHAVKYPDWAKFNVVFRQDQEWPVYCDVVPASPNFFDAARDIVEARIQLLAGN